jgi:arginyl-tRNA synthetase
LEVLSQRTYQEAKKRNSNLSEMDLVKISDQVAIGALRYAMIKQDLDKIITFDLTESLSLEGDSGPYIQYSYARAKRIMGKAGKDPNFEASFDQMLTTYEKDLAKLIGKFDIQVEDAARNLSPKVIAKYCHDLAVTFNTFYEHVNVLTAETESLMNVRLCLVYSFKETLASALGLLGIEAPDRM